MENETFDREDLLSKMGQEQLLVQDSPVLPGVWSAFLEKPRRALDLLITPHRDYRPAQLAFAVRKRLGKRHAEGTEESEVAFNQSHVVAVTSFDDLIRGLVPLSSWYRRVVSECRDLVVAVAEAKSGKKRKSVLAALARPHGESKDLPAELLWWLRLTGSISLGAESSGRLTEEPDAAAILDRALDLISKPPPAKTPQLFRIGVNRDAEKASVDSMRTIKADVANRIFKVDTSQICWAVMDSGIDADHPAFRESDSRASPSRVIETWDFTGFRKLINLGSTPGDDAETELMNAFGVTREEAKGIGNSLLNGGDINWEALKPALRVPASERKEYTKELDPHGTHVAGILGGRGDAKASEEEGFQGVCPQIRLIDIRILDATGASGRIRRTDREFEILAALQFVAHRNAIGDQPQIHGVNLSIQLLHNPREFACGGTPVCEACNRLVASGVVVVAASGNKGIEAGTRSATTFEGSFTDISISDPGNAASVITVGSTHRNRPHEYGVSYFSGRGPTGDGRDKPDIIAPGEKILGPTLGKTYQTMSGTSQAAPHVSGAAALLLARHGEFIGDAAWVKQVLCDSATDLRRHRHFQGTGLVDILRALQST